MTSGEIVAILIRQDKHTTKGNKVKAVVLTTDNTVEVEQDTDEFVSYATLSRAVGGLIEAVSLPNGLTLWVNEEGKNDGLAPNVLATRLFVSAFGAVDVIVGNAIVTGGADEDGETLGLTDEQVTELVAELLYAGAPLS